MNDQKMAVLIGDDGRVPHVIRADQSYLAETFTRACEWRQNLSNILTFR